ncbi:hypothetical protein [Pedobacter psychrodurus]|uniref:hypothetical protein n=1 Tax=Pedobacter psychrodurus TaxID=2530456 RepID=UPI00292F7BB2|nr:hypothetical protein [Pedobacter psychrodurus]
MVFIEKDNVDILIGNNLPVETGRVAKFLDYYLISLAMNGDNLPNHLFEHNLYGKRDVARQEFAKVDADVVLEIDIKANKLYGDLRDYRKYKEFAREYDEQRVVVHIMITGVKKTNWVIHLPLQCLMKGFGDPLRGYQCYGHGITLFDERGEPKRDELFYCGITGRNWLVRMAEHFRDIEKGSKKLFHRKWREYRNADNVMLNSELIVLNQSHTGAMDWEEWIVERYKKEKRSLNMIPGGFKGAKMLHKFNYFKKNPSKA